ncbi:hypothetical protein HW532_06800 [Kaustia mangrovi]|uniref:Uncharacterized protein n=1 Tax=Kaustia mangrovi TaxID=2593653 RepID=A0A7S8C315_9HYPH|nr:hypothetical protein [Kaustia mangrovi]QPC42440.1 hypothetical protein HW532_06800 [Kaustia mangrovi]
MAMDIALPRGLTGPDGWRRRAGAVACLLLVLAALAAWASPLEARSGERNPVFRYGGNEFIIRRTVSGGTLYLRAYRAAGDQWEPYARTSLPVASEKARRREVEAWARNRNAPLRHGKPSLVERIYFTGKPLGYSTIDLDNPMNTDLNRFNGRMWP